MTEQHYTRDVTPDAPYGPHTYTFTPVDCPSNTLYESARANGKADAINLLGNIRDELNRFGPLDELTPSGNLDAQVRSLVNYAQDKQARVAEQADELNKVYGQLHEEKQARKGNNTVIADAHKALSEISPSSVGKSLVDRIKAVADRVDTLKSRADAQSITIENTHKALDRANAPYNMGPGLLVDRVTAAVDELIKLREATSQAPCGHQSARITELERQLSKMGEAKAAMETERNEAMASNIELKKLGADLSEARYLRKQLTDLRAVHDALTKRNAELMIDLDTTSEEARDVGDELAQVEHERNHYLHVVGELRGKLHKIEQVIK